MTAATTELFALGYAQATTSHPVGLTERARRACRAALRVAETVPEPSGLPSLILGQLEGIWAVIYSRREEVEAAHAGAFKKILKSISDLDWASIVAAVRTQVLIDPGITGEMLAGEIRTRIYNMISGDLPAADRAAWRQAMQDALTDGMAEGQTAATAILSDATAIDWDLTTEQAKAALRGGTALGDAADAWIQQQTQGLGYQLSQKLASLWDDEASSTEMIDAIMDMLGSDANMASLLLDSAIGQSISQGALATYALADIAYADFVTAGDSRVCAECASTEDGGPYQLFQCPQPPMHVRCRCTIAPSDYLARSLTIVPEDS